jgi:hypothetical protein
MKFPGFTIRKLMLTMAMIALGLLVAQEFWAGKRPRSVVEGIAPRAESNSATTISADWANRLDLSLARDCSFFPSRSSRPSWREPFRLIRVDPYESVANSPMRFDPPPRTHFSLRALRIALRGETIMRLICVHLYLSLFICG